MGDFAKHLSITKEKMASLEDSYAEERYTVVGDLSFRVLEQLIEAAGALQNEHFGGHTERLAYSKSELPPQIHHSVLKVWRLDGELAYSGADGGTARQIMEAIYEIVVFFEERFGEKISSAENK